MAQDKKRRIAAADLPVMEATIKQLFRFSTLEQAHNRLAQISAEFEIAGTQESEEGTELKLWIKGFSITDEELKNGALGNYALIRPRKVAEGHFILLAEKLEVEITKHPQRARPQQKHPNWGHPVLRSVKKKKTYDTIEAAQAEIELLHREYPEASIPGIGKLFLMIYEKPGGGVKGPPIQKYVLEIKSDAQGKFYLASRSNTYKKKAAPKGVAANYTTPNAKRPLGEDAVQGRFTSMIQVKRARKKPMGGGGGSGGTGSAGGGQTES